MKIFKQTIFIIFALAFQFKVHAQDKKTCDSLVGKSNAFIVTQADEIFLGKVADVENGKFKSDYKIIPLHAYKGQIEEDFRFTQNQNAQFFSFIKDSSFVFLIFKDFHDDIFSSSFLFGKEKNMTYFLTSAEKFCQPRKRPLDGSCERSINILCGCDGIEYDECKQINGVLLAG